MKGWAGGRVGVKREKYSGVEQPLKLPNLLSSKRQKTSYLGWTGATKDSFLPRGGHPLQLGMMPESCPPNTDTGSLRYWLRKLKLNAISSTPRCPLLTNKLFIGSHISTQNEKCFHILLWGRGKWTQLYSLSSCCPRPLSSPTKAHCWASCILGM